MITRRRVTRIAATIAAIKAIVSSLSAFPPTGTAFAPRGCPRAEPSRAPAPGSGRARTANFPHDTGQLSQTRATLRQRTAGGDRTTRQLYRVQRFRRRRRSRHQSTLRQDMPPYVSSVAPEPVLLTCVDTGVAYMNQLLYPRGRGRGLLASPHPSASPEAALSSGEGLAPPSSSRRRPAQELRLSPSEH